MTSLCISSLTPDIFIFFCGILMWTRACSTDLYALTSDIDYKPNSFPPLLPDVFGKLDVCSLFCLSVVCLCTPQAGWVCCLTPLSPSSCPYLGSFVRKADSLILRVLVNISFCKECWGRLRIGCALLVSWQSFHALRLCNRTSGGGQSGLRRMDDPRGTFRAGLPSAAPGTAGSALHHEQTVGKTLKLKLKQTINWLKHL